MATAEIESSLPVLSRPEPSHGLRILVADDDPSIRALLSRLFALYQPSEVELVADGAEALKALSRGSYSGAVLDHEMPGLDGLVVARAIRNEVTTRLMPIMIVSAHSHEDVVSAFSEIGIDEYLRKPINPVIVGPRLEAFVSTCNRYHMTASRKRV